MVYLGLLLFLFPFSFDNKAPVEPKRVIQIAVDGVRESEAYLLKIEREGMFVNWHSNCKVSQPYNVSLPAYASMFSGKAQANIRNNYFRGALENPTLFQEYPSELYSAWPLIVNVMGNKSKATIVPGSVYDYEDFRIFESYIKKTKRPKFTFMHLGDSDEFAHIGSWHDYIESIKNARHYIYQIIAENEAHKPNETVYVVLTDHGRGSGRAWRNHGAWYPNSSKIWVQIVSPRSYSLKDCSHVGVHSFIKSLLQ